MEKTKLLYLGTSKEQCRHFQQLVEKQGVEVITATTPVQAMTRASQCSYSVAVVDLHYSDREVYELVGKLIQLLRNTMFLVVTEKREPYWNSDHPLFVQIAQHITRPWRPLSMVRSVLRALALRAHRLGNQLGQEVSQYEHHLVSSTQTSEIAILLIEDDPAIVDLIGRKLLAWNESPKYDLRVSSTLPEAIDLLTNQNFALILIDLDIPNSQGTMAVSQLLSVTSAPIVTIVDSKDEQIVIDAINLGAQDYLERNSLDSVVLHRVIRYTIERERVQGRYFKLLWQSPEAIIVVDELGKIVFSNPAAGVLFNCPHESLLGQPLNYPLLGRQRAEVQISVDKFAEIQVVNSDWRGRFAQIVSLRDITKYKQKEFQLIYQAHHDALTGLANRALLMDRLDQSILKAKRNSRIFAVLMLDLDHFKLINDSLGHDAGDELLKNAATKLTNVVRKSDTVARLGGDEFVVLADEIHCEEDATGLARKIISSMEEPFVLKGRKYAVTASVGVAVFPRDGDREQSLLKNADAALYQAKKEGRNLYQIYDPRSHQASKRLMELEQDLEAALQNKQFCVHYQPVFTSAGLVGAEAFMRWEHPQKGLLSPDMFMMPLERRGLIYEAELWLLKTACTQLQCWRQKISPRLHMSVNLSATTLHQTTLVAEIQSLLTDWELPHRCLEVEINEAVLSKDVTHMVRSLRKSNVASVNIALDDFDTDLFTLDHLMQLPKPNALKLDRAMTEKLTATKKGRLILKVIVEMAHSLDIEVVAEGVESPEQLKWLRKFQCDRFQGYLFAPPLSAQAWELFCSHWEKSTELFFPKKS